MLGYRLYFMDAFSGHIDHRREFLAEDDAAAMEIAAGWRTSQPCELWQGSRKLKRWEAAEQFAALPGDYPATRPSDGV